jgi:hypothetical protein
MEDAHKTYRHTMELINTTPSNAFVLVLARDNPFATLDRDYLMALTERFGSDRKPDLSDDGSNEPVAH